jgi:hypothetical protein
MRAPQAPRRLPVLPRALLLALGIGPAFWAGPACAAFEWRAGWGSPQTLAAIGEWGGRDAAGVHDSGGVHAAVAIARPFGVTGLTFTRAQIMGIPRGWEAHAGCLSAEAYRESHIGIGRRVELGRESRLLIGLRAFWVHVGEETLPVRLGGTLVLTARPARMRIVALEAGIVDLPLSRADDAVAALLVARLTIESQGRRLRMERLARSGGDSETTWACSLPLGWCRLTEALRARTGEASLFATFDAGNAEAGVGAGWHPQLGWTPLVSLRWLPGR